MFIFKYIKTHNYISMYINGSAYLFDLQVFSVFPTRCIGMYSYHDIWFHEKHIKKHTQKTWVKIILFHQTKVLSYQVNDTQGLSNYRWEILVPNNVLHMLGIGDNIELYFLRSTAILFSIKWMILEVKTIKERTIYFSRMILSS